MNQFSHYCVLYGVSKLAALAQALITLGSVDSPKHPEHLQALSQLVVRRDAKLLLHIQDPSPVKLKRLIIQVK
jgi:hypothetical protein